MNYLYFNRKKIPATILENDKEFALSFPYNKELLTEIKTSMEERRWDNSQKIWIFQKTSRNMFVLDYFMNKNPYKIYNLPLPEYNFSNWKHQNKIYSHIITRKRVIVAGEMRTGKTRPVLQAITDTCCDSAWWIAPKSALRGLKDELRKWNFKLKIILISYDKFRRLSPGLVPKFLVFDECQKLKNPKSKQGSLAREMAEQQKIKFNDDRYIVLLSGTPAPKDPSDWWNLSEIACPGFLKEKDIYTFKNRLGEYSEEERIDNGQKYLKLIEWKQNEIELLHTRLEGLVEVFLKKDCLDLPEKFRNKIKLNISKEYLQAVQLLHTKHEKAANLLNKLRQLSDGFQYIPIIDEVKAIKTNKIKYLPNCPKDKQLEMDLEEFEDVGRVIIYCGFQATLDKIVNICSNKGWSVLKVDGRGWSTLNTILSIDDCLAEMDGSRNLGKIEKLAFCAQADAASTGLELSASPICIYYSNSYNGAARMQSEDRAHSINQKVGLEIRDYIHLPVDELTLNNLLTKKTLQAITLGDIEEVMKGVWHE